MKRCSYCGRETDPAAATCGECGTPFSEDLSSEPKLELANPSHERQCPSCGEAAAHERVFTFSRRWNWGLILLIGLLGAMLWRGGKKGRFRCGGCGTLFDAHTHITKVSRLLAWLFLALSGLSILTVVLIFLSDSR